MNKCKAINRKLIIDQALSGKVLGVRAEVSYILTPKSQTLRVARLTAF